MARFARTAVEDFALANEAYVGATVTFYQVDGSGARLPTLISLFSDVTGTEQLPNPQELDSSGKLEQPAYFEEPFIAVADLGGVSTAQTGIVQPSITEDQFRQMQRAAHLAATAMLSSTAMGALLTQVRERLQAARTYYVRTDGSNSNTGLVDSAGGAFLTIQKAIDTVANNLDLNGQDVTIQVRTGTYTGAVVVQAPWVGTGTVTLQGDTVTPANVVISTTSAAAITVKNPGTRLALAGFKLQTTTSGSGLVVTDKAEVTTNGAMNYGAMATGGSHIMLARAGAVFITAGYTISGAAAAHWQADYLSLIWAVSITITVTGTPAIASAFASCTNLSNIIASGITFVGSATGGRYAISLNGVINTGGGGANYLPGNSAGSSATGGQYA